MLFPHGNMNELIRPFFFSFFFSKEIRVFVFTLSSFVVQDFSTNCNAAILVGERKYCNIVLFPRLDGDV